MTHQEIIDELHRLADLVETLHMEWANPTAAVEQEISGQLQEADEIAHRLLQELEP